MVLSYDRQTASGRAPTPGASLRPKLGSCGGPRAKARGCFRTRKPGASVPPHLWKHTLHSELDATSPVSGQWLPATVFPQVAIPQPYRGLRQGQLHLVALLALLAPVECESDLGRRFRCMGPDPVGETKNNHFLFSVKQSFQGCSRASAQTVVLPAHQHRTSGDARRCKCRKRSLEI